MWTHVNGDSVVGTFVELLPSRRIVFTYGWDRDDVRIPPGSTTVVLARLAALAEGRDPGPDPLAAERVPAALETGLQ